MANLYRAANEIDATLNKIMQIGEVIEQQQMAIANGEYPPTPQEVIDDGEPEDFVQKNFDYNELQNRAIATAQSMENTYAEGGQIGISDQQYYDIMERVAKENNPIWNKQRIKEGLQPLSEDEEYLRILNDNTYDYRGYYNKYPDSRANADTHWNDEFKTVYHPTFSKYSTYSEKVDPNYNPKGLKGGDWDNNGNFIPEYWQMDNLFPTGGWINNAVNNLAAQRNRIETSYSPEDIALQRSNAATQPYSNYMKAEDLVPNLDLAVKQILDYGVSNCTLTASGFFNPDGRFARARTIASNPQKTGFYQVDKEHAIPGTMIIASLPGKDDSPKGGNIYHTMIISGYAPNDYTYNFKGKKYQVKKGDVLVNYSRGGRSADNYVKNVPLKVYTANSDGKTVNRFYRPLDNNGNPAVLLPNVQVTGTRKTK